MGFILFIHVVACILLVIAVLMQAGRGGGLTETFQSAESMFGTQTNAFMVRFTTILAVIFLSTSLILAFNSSRGNKSLMSNHRLLPAAAKSESPKTVTPSAAESPNANVQVTTPVTNATK